MVLGLILYFMVNKLFFLVGLGVFEEFDDSIVVIDGIFVLFESNIFYGKKFEVEDK